MTPYHVHWKFPDIDEMARLWGWIVAEPGLNIDDAGPKTIEQFHAGMQAKKLRGVAFFVVSTPSLGPVGCFGLEAIGCGVLKFAGLCFAPYVRGTGVAHEAVTDAIAGLRLNDGNGRKVVAEFFGNNIRVKAFFEGLGFAHEATFKDETKVGGQLIDVERWVLFQEKGGK